MPFKGTLVGRALHILGSGGAKIIGRIDHLGKPRFDFYSGSAKEVEPASIATNVIDTPPFYYSDVILEGVFLEGTNSTQPFIRLAATYDENANTNESYLELFAQDAIRIVVGGLISNPSGILNNSVGRKLYGWNFGKIVAQTTDVNGIHKVNHLLQHEPSFAAAICTEANSQVIPRVVDNQTNSTEVAFRFRNSATHAILTNTNVTYYWLALRGTAGL